MLSRNLKKTSFSKSENWIFLLKFYNGKWEEIESIRLDSGNPFLMISAKMEENVF